MQLVLSHAAYRYEMENLCRLFFPREALQATEGMALPVHGRWAAALLEDGAARGAVGQDGQVWQTVQPLAGGAGKEERERCLAVALYGAFAAMTGRRPAWGVLTGVRPVKLFEALTREQGDPAAAADYMADRLLVSRDKIELCRLSAEAERRCTGVETAAAVPFDDYSLYVAIPFCPTRCAYCSFVSHSIDKAKKLVQPYLDRLEQELAATADLADRLGLRLRTVYIGGGTPTTLSAAQLDRLIGVLHDRFDLDGADEFTVEAGRPDTLTRERLEALQRGGVTRLAVNPQTLDDRVLQAIGRRHTAAQTLEGFALARACGFDNINMDLIAGLPLDTPDGFARTLDGVLALGPEGVTVHTLALKRSARLNTAPASLASGEVLPEKADDAAPTAAMLDTARQKLTTAGYRPYYLYRQSKMVGNLENVGWSLPGREGLYNIYMMNELHTVLAAGAGAVTRLKHPATGDIRRVFNFKYPYEYIDRFDEMLARKADVDAFYARHRAEDKS